MRPELIDRLTCRRCRNSGLEIDAADHDEKEIRRGSLCCPHCKAVYNIRDGIVNLLQDPGLEKDNPDSERYWEEKFGLDDRWLLSLPRPTIDFDTSFESKGGVKAANFFAMAHALGLAGDETLLELSAGTCWTSAHFAQMGCRCVAADIDRRKYSGLRSADVYLRGRGIFFERMLCEIGPLPLADRSFDVVFIQSGLQFAPDLNQAIREIARVLCPNGKLALAYTGVRGLFKWGDRGPGYALTRYTKEIQGAGLRPRLLYPALCHRLLPGSAVQRLPDPDSRGMQGMIAALIRLSGSSFNLIATKEK